MAIEVGFNPQGRQMLPGIEPKYALRCKLAMMGLHLAMMGLH